VEAVAAGVPVGVGEGVAEGTGELLADGEGLELTEAEAEGLVVGLAEGLTGEPDGAWEAVPVVTVVVCPVESFATTTTVLVPQQPFPFTPEATNNWPGQMLQPTGIRTNANKTAILIFFLMVILPESFNNGKVKERLPFSDSLKGSNHYVK
jgi:hypothetical protein